MSPQQMHQSVHLSTSPKCPSSVSELKTQGVHAFASRETREREHGDLGAKRFLICPLGRNTVCCKKSQLTQSTQYIPGASF